MLLCQILLNTLQKPEESKKEFIEALVDEALANAEPPSSRGVPEYGAKDKEEQEGNTEKQEGGDQCRVHRGMSGRTVTIESDEDVRRQTRFSLW